jgi:FAD/FMN-containing dehydrogenase
MSTNSLQQRVSGRVIHRADAAYEEVRRRLVWNGVKPDRHPELVLHASSEKDVVEGVRYAREHKLQVAIRGTGHNWNGASLRNGGLLIDLSALRGMTLDTATNTAELQPAATNREVAEQLAQRGLAFPLGHCSSVGVGGYLLNGGFGWNAGSWGLGCHNVLSMRVVTASGEIVTASPESNPDLYWAARGAGPGFFGIVTSFKVFIHPMPKSIRTSALLFPASRYLDAVRWSAEVLPSLPPNLELSMMLTNAPPPLAVYHPKICMVAATVFSDSAEEAAKALSVLEHCPVQDRLHQDLNLDTPFSVLYDMMDQVYPDGRRYAVDTMWSVADPVTVLGQAADHYSRAPASGESLMVSFLIPPPPPGVEFPDTAFSMMGSVGLGFYGIWQDPSQDQAHHDWVRGAMKALEPMALGYYIGETDVLASPDRARRSYGPEQWERLQAVRRKYDPDGVFFSYL